MRNSDYHDGRRARVLLLAYSCMPNRGSEPGAGWNRVCHIGRCCDAWVLCEGNECAKPVRDYLEEHGNQHELHFRFLPQNFVERLLSRFLAVHYLAYNLWHRRALRVARRLHAEIHFDLVHQITLSTFREPGYLWKLDAPFVWGPVSGTQNFPWRFLAQEGLGTAVLESLRSVVNRLQLRFTPRVCRAVRRASAIMAATSTNQRDLADAQQVSATLLCDVGTTRASGAPRVGGALHRPLRIFWSGEFRGLKALSLLIEALAQLPQDVSYELRVAGAGWKRRRWQRLARRTGVDRHTTWLGWLPFEEAQQQYQWADIFVFTSMRDTTGTVVLEALAAGLPVICMDHQGVHDVVTPECGIKIPVTTPADAIAKISQAIGCLARSAEKRESLGRGALDRARELSWSKRGAQMIEVYRRVLGDRFLLEPRDSAAPACAAAGASHGEAGGSRSENAVSRWHLKPQHGLPQAPQQRPLQPVLRVNGSHPARSRVFAPHRWHQPMVYLRDRTVGQISVGLSALFGSRAGNRPGILTYHRNASVVAGLPTPGQNVPAGRLHSQLSGLLDRGFTFWPLRKILDCCRNDPDGLPPRVVAVTFDDGYATSWLHAWPVLRELNVPATVFLATAYLDGSEPFPFDAWGVAVQGRAPTEAYRPLTSEECRRMSEDGLVEIGAHTHTHEDFRGRPEAFCHDLRQCLAVLATQFGIQEPTFAFPWGVLRLGFANGGFTAAARQVGVICGLTMQSALVEPASDFFTWGRFNVYAWDSDATLAAKLQGWYSWAPQLKQRALATIGLGCSEKTPATVRGNQSPIPSKLPPIQGSFPPGKPEHRLSGADARGIAR